MNRACQPSTTCIQRSIAAAGISCLAGQLPSPVSLFLAVHIINFLWGIHHHPSVEGLIQPIKALCLSAKAEQQPCQTPGKLTMKHKAIGTPPSHSAKGSAHQYPDSEISKAAVAPDHHGPPVAQLSFRAFPSFHRLRKILERKMRR